MGNTIEPTMTKARARQVTKAIQQTAGDLWDLLRVAHEGMAWEPLGYPSWDAYVRAEFDMTRQNANRLIAQAEVIAAIEAALPVQVERARSTPPPVSARQAPKAKKKLPAIVDAVSRGVDPAAAVKDAIGPEAGATTSRGAGDQPRWWVNDPQKALTVLVDLLTDTLGPEPMEKALRVALRRVTQRSTPEPTSKPDGCDHPKDRVRFNGNYHFCTACNSIVKKR